MARATTARTANAALHEATQNTNAVFVISKIFHLGAMLTDDAEMIDELKEFIEEELDENILNDLKPNLDLSRLRKLLEEGLDEAEMLQEFAWECAQRGRFGFLCEARCPQVEVLEGIATKQLTWGIQRTRWFYDEDLAGIIQQADAWAKSQERRVAKFGGGALTCVDDGDDL